MGIRILVLLFTLVNSALAVTFDEAVDISINEASGTGINEVIYGLDDVLSEGMRVDGWWESVTLPYDGYLFLVDPAPDMLWGHDCTWAFVSRSDGTVTTYDMQTPPDILFNDMEVLDAGPFGTNIDYIEPFPAQIRFFDDEERLISSEQFEGKRHALLISGGRDKYLNYLCFWGNIAFTYRVLVNYYGWDKSDIRVCMSDGDDPADDRYRPFDGFDNSPTDLDGDGVQDYDTPADRENVINALNDLVNSVDPGDIVFVFITNHGTRPSGWINPEEVGVCLWGPNPEHNLWDYELAGCLKQLPDDALKIVSVFSCYSGGFIDEIEGNGIENIVVCTPCGNWETVDADFYFMNTTHDWLSALNWSTEDIYHPPVSVNADSDRNGLCEIDEAFDWMVMYNTGASTPQMYNTGDLSEVATLYSNMNGPILICDSIEQSDDTAHGNDDGYFEPNEEIALYITLRNVGLSTARNVYAGVTSGDRYVDVISGKAPIPDIGPREVSINTLPLVVKVKDELPYNKVANIDIEYSWNANSKISKGIFTPIFYDKDLIGLYDDIEHGVANWYEKGTGEWEQQDEYFYSPTHAWGFDSNGNGLVCSAIYTPPAILSQDIVNNKLDFYHKFSGVPDRAFAYVDINDGTGWTNLAMYSGSAPPSFAKESKGINDFIGSIVQFRFRAQYNEGEVYSYWYLDDISVGNISNLQYFDAVNYRNNICITWGYETADNISGFNLYRREVGGTGMSSYGADLCWILVNDELIIGDAQITYIDTSVRVNTEYEYRLEAVLSSGRVVCGYNKCYSIEDNGVLPKTYSLSQNYPNPSSGVTIISFGLPEQTSVSLEAYDLKGRCVARLIEDRVMAPGIYSMDFDTSLLSEGIYIYRMETLDYSATKKLIVIH